tara:strand:- start:285 stop:776 length:492 start_codon:yes stop_codon:yes gene_type:complete
MNKKIYLYNNINKMKWLYIFFLLTPCLSFLSGTRKLNILDKSHVKNYVDSWIDIWKTVPTPISDLRINEAWKSVIWCSQYKFRDDYYCLTYKHNNYFVLLIENSYNKTLNVEGILESPDNIYSYEQTEQLNLALQFLANRSNLTLNYKPLKNWSHGFYFYEYQ